MTHSESDCAADRPPEMYRRATFATVVSRISMNVGTTTMTAMTHMLTAGRLRTADWLNATLLMVRSPCAYFLRQ